MLAVLGLALVGCMQTTTTKLDVTGIKVASPANVGRAVTVEVGYTSSPCGIFTAQLTPFEKNSAGEAVRVVEARVVQETRAGEACVTLAVMATSSATFTPQTTGEWTLKGIGSTGPTVTATFSVI